MSKKAYELLIAEQDKLDRDWAWHKRKFSLFTGTVTVLLCSALALSQRQAFQTVFAFSALLGVRLWAWSLRGGWADVDKANAALRAEIEKLRVAP